MQTRIWLASGVAICAVALLVNGPARAAEPAAPATGAPIWTGLVPDDAFAAVVLYPKRVLAGESLAKLDVKGLAQQMTDRFGYSPLEVDEAILLMAPPAARDQRAPQGGGIFRLSNPIDKAAMVAALWKPRKAEEAEVDGHKYFRPEGAAAHPAPGGDVGIYFIDERTFVSADLSWLPKVLAAKGAKSALISALAGVNPADDATIIFTNTDAAKEMIAENLPAKAFPGPLKPLGELPALLRGAKLSVRTNPEISLKLTLIGNDEASAEKIAAMIKSFQQLGQAFLPALQAPPDETMPAEQRESRAYATAVATKLVNGLVPHETGKQVTVEIGHLGTLDSLVGKVVMPAITAARAAAHRVQGTNNLKQLALAMLASETVHGHFPAHAIYSKDGKPLLSWRVYVLPYLDEQQLFDQFHLDEPWDSEHNKPLIAKMPSVFKDPNGKPLAIGQTRYLVPVGKDTIFDGDKGIEAAKITDGTSQTILILEVGEDKAVTWTKPDDMRFDAQKPLAGLGTIADPGVFAVVFADGHVMTTHRSIDAETFRHLILRNDGPIGLPPK